MAGQMGKFQRAVRVSLLLAGQELLGKAQGICPKPK